MEGTQLQLFGNIAGKLSDKVKPHLDKFKEELERLKIELEKKLQKQAAFSASIFEDAKEKLLEKLKEKNFDPRDILDCQDQLKKLKEKLGVGYQYALNDKVARLKDAVDQFTSEETRQKLKELLEGLLRETQTYGIGGIKDKLMDKIKEDAKEGMKDFKGISDALQEKGKEMKDGLIEQMDKSVKDFNEKIKDAKGKGKEMGDNVAGGLKKLQKNLDEKLKGGFDKASKEMKGALKKITGGINNMQGKAGDVTKKLKNRLGEMKETAEKEVKSKIEKLEGFVGELKKKVVDINMKEKVKDIVMRLQGGFIEVKEIFGEKKKLLEDKLRDAKEKGEKLGEQLGKDMKEIAIKLSEVVGSTGKELIEQCKEFIKNLEVPLKDVKGKVDDLVAEMKKVLNDKIIDGIKGEIVPQLKKELEEFKNGVKKEFDEAKEKLKSCELKLKEEGKKLLEDTSRMIKDAFDKTRNSPQQFAQEQYILGDFVEGMLNATQGILNEVKNITDVTGKLIVDILDAPGKLIGGVGRKRKQKEDSKETDKKEGQQKEDAKKTDENEGQLKEDIN